MVMAVTMVTQPILQAFFEGGVQVGVVWVLHKAASCGRRPSANQVRQGGGDAGLDHLQPQEAG